MVKHGEPVTKRTKKRKQRSSAVDEQEEEVQERNEGPSKAFRLDQPEKGNEEIDDHAKAGSPWRNLRLILSLQDKAIRIPEKVDTAFGFVKAKIDEKASDVGQETQLIHISRVLVFLNDWIQSVLIYSEKSSRVEGNNVEPETAGLCLDYRCWEIFKFCLEESKKLHVSLTISKDFLRVVHCIVSHALSDLPLECLCNQESPLSDEQLKVYNTVLYCISVAFSLNGGVSNENLKLWMSLMDTVIEVVLRITVNNLDGNETGIVILQLSCYLLEAFSKFLRVHHTRKNGFRDLIDKLLEPLLHLLDVVQFNNSDTVFAWRRKLSELVEESLSQALFHQTHIDGFLKLRSSVRYKNSDDTILKEEKVVNKSYQRYLFDKLEDILTRKNVLALGGVGGLLHLFANRVRRQNGISLAQQGNSKLEVSSSPLREEVSQERRSLGTRKPPNSGTVDTETRKSLFDFFIQITESLLKHINRRLQDGEVGAISSDIHSILKSINRLLATMIYEKVYIRTEDTTEGASRNFLRLIYETIMLFSSKIDQTKISSFASNRRIPREVLISVMKELIIALHHLLEIEYEVVGDEVEGLWTMIFSCISCSHCLLDVPGQPLLLSEILRLGCRLINLYSELRQVSTSMFALCKAVRHFGSQLSDGEASSQLYTSYLNSLCILLRSSDFRLSICTAIKTIPEGQAAGCIRQLSSDISESLDWLKVESNSAVKSELIKPSQSESGWPHTQFLGRILSDVYTLILDSVTVTSNNSYLVGDSVRNLIETIRPYLGRVVSSVSNNNEEFLSFDGIVLNMISGHENVSMCWILVLLFRLYLSCRSLYQQAISLVPPDAAKKMVVATGNPCRATSGRDWLEETSSRYEGYFFWICPSAYPLLDVMHSVSNFYLRGSTVGCPALVYALNAMALQRLVDLNRLIKDFEYMHLWSENRVQMRLEDTDVSSSYRKKISKCRKLISGLKKEAAGLTKYLMGSVKLLDKEHIAASLVKNEMFENIPLKCNEDILNFSVGCVDEVSLPFMLWLMICQNIDIWCAHAVKRDLKKFLSLIIESSLSCVGHDIDEFKENKVNIPSRLMHAARVASLQFLSNTISYEQRFVHRYMASRFCKILQKTVSAVFADYEVDLCSPIDWDEVILAIENSYQAPNNKFNTCNILPTLSCSSSKLKRCQGLLNLLNWMPKEYLSKRSSSLYILCLLNLERFLVGSFLVWHGAFCSQDPSEIFILFASCRRILKNLILATTEERIKGNQPAFTSILSKSCSPLSWLLKSLSVAVELQYSFRESIDFHIKHAAFTSIDHTSHIFFATSKYLLGSAICSCTFTKRLGKEKSTVGRHESSDLIEHDLHLEKDHTWKNVKLVSEMLKEHMQNLLPGLEEVFLGRKLDVLFALHEINKLSPIVACVRGFLLGITSAMDSIHPNAGSFITKLSRYETGPLHGITLCVDMYTSLVSLLLKESFLDNAQFLEVLSNKQNPDTTSRSGDQLVGDSESIIVSAQHEDEMRDTGSPGDCIAPPGVDYNPDKYQNRNKYRAGIADIEAFLTKVEYEKFCLKKSLIQEFLRGENIEAAFFLRQLCLASSAVLKLHLYIGLKCTSWTFVPVLAGICQDMLLGFVNTSGAPHPYCSIWLDGFVKFLEELGSYFPLFDPSLSRNLYTLLLGLHMRAIGKCISLQGKQATLATEETESCVKMPDSPVEFSESYWTDGLNKLKATLKKSFRMYLRESLDLHFSSAIEVVERAIVGVQQGSVSNNEIQTGNSSGGKVSSNVAAGIDCLDSVLESITGHKHLSMVKRKIQGLVDSLFNVILHLQGPNIFYKYDTFKDHGCPHSGSVILMCIEVLTKVSGKHAVFHLDTRHIAQSLRVPSALFQDFLLLQATESRAPSESLMNTNSSILDQKFLVELHRACSRLLCTVLKHHKNETQHCVALLEDSVRVLLQCLEIVKADPGVRSYSLAWELEEAVKCACGLRRIYEEVRQQRDVLGRSCFQLLSCYIWVYCGYGVTKTGLKREINEALKPGVYALIDACSADDLQLLHTTFGEGPCRSTLATLQHEYKLNFQFEGKV